MSARKLFLFISLILGVTYSLSAQTDEAKPVLCKYDIRIELRDAYIGGILIMKEEGEQLNASIVNEFGISLLSCQYFFKTGKLKLTDCVRYLNKPFIRRILKTDLRTIMAMYHESHGNLSLPFKYDNHRFDIRYNITAL